MMTDYHNSLPRNRRPRWWLFGVLALCVVGVFVLALTGNRTFTVIGSIAHLGGADIGANVTPLANDPEYAMPSKDPNRLNILLLGIRGKDDVADGGSLTDTIMLFSMDKTTGVAALTSIPRDLTLRVTDTKTEKINTAYVYNGLQGAKKLFSRVTGVYIDNAVLMDFNAFKDVVDTLGGISITLDKPFSESEQWAGTASQSYVFKLPAGTSTLTGDQALYYVRSRYSTSDFDRARRQQQVIMAIRDKVNALHLNQDPLKALQLVLAVRKHVETDLNIFDIGTLKDLIAEGDQLAKIHHYQLTTENLLYETMASGTYELLPLGGTLAHIKTFFKTVTSDTPIIWTPQPTPSATPTPRIRS